MEDKVSESSVKVAVRIRPQLARERIEMCRVCTNVTPNEPQVVIGQDKAFTFDYVFDMDISQHHIYDTCASKLIEGMFDGFNATILAYGQTGSGKTYTMGTAFDMHVDEGESKIGIIPRAVEHLFMGIEERRRKAQDAGGPVPEFTVNTQFMELYNEELFDLLDTTRDPSDKQRKSHVKIHEDGRGEIFTVGITTRPVTSLHETLQLLKAGTLSRTTASTNMNTQSSRSHAIFTILMRQQRISSAESQPADVEVLTAKFNFVDLAGSERLKRTGATGDRAKEGISINCGLLALGNVISALGDEEKQGCHVPYRDSKLTRLLQDSLGGNSCTTMIACISPSDCDFVETLSTLKYANRARNIRNKVVVNQDSTSRQLSSMRAEIQMLQQELMDFRTGRRVADSECISDVVRENEILRVENLSLRQRSKALQDTIDSLTKRNTQLVTEREQMSLTARIEGGDGDSGDGTVGKLIESYVQQIEQLQSSLIESNAVADSLRQSVSTPRYASSAHNFAPSVVAASVPVDVLLDDDGHVQQLIDEAKDDVMKLKQLTERAHTKAAAEDGEKMDPDENANLESNLSDSEAEEDECHKLNEKLADLLGEISIKQKLIDELELSQKRLRAMRAQYEEKLGLLAKKIRETETERDKVLSGLGSASKPADDANVKKVRADYDAKLGSLQTELRQLQAAKREHSKLLRNQTHYETQMRTLKADLVALKQLKVKLMKQLQEEAQKSRQTEQRAQKTIAQLEKQKRMKETMIKSLETERQQKDIVLKRKMEEVAALRKQQKAGMSAKAAGRVAKYSGRSQVDGGAQPVNEEPSRCDVSAEEEELDPRMFKSSWLNLEKIINSVIVKRQTLTHLDKEMDRWIKQREAVGKKLDRLLKAQEKAIASDVEVVNLSDLNEQIDTLRDNMTFIQDNINDCQNSIVDLEEFQEEEVEADKIFVTSSLTEAMYLLEHCTDLAVNNGLAAALKTVECHELEAKLQQEQMENVFQRDVLSYLIQDKVELAADGGTPWQENEDDSDEPSYSLSPVDSLEDRGETTPFKLDTQLAEKDLTANVTNPLIGISPAVDEQQRTTAFVEKAALPSSQQQDKTKPDLSVKKTPVASRAVKKPVSQQPPDTSAASSSAARPRSASSMVSLSPMRRPRSAKPSSPETPQSSANVESTGGRPVDPSPVKAVPIPTAARGVISSPAAGSALPPRGSCPLVHRHTAVGHTKAVLAVCASDTIMCSAGKDHTAKIWDLTAGVEIRCLDRHVSSVVSVKYNPAESLVYTASAYLVKVWDTRQADCLHTLTSAGLTSEGRLLDDNDLSKPVCCPPGEINIAAIALGNRNNTLYSAAGNTVRIWDLRMLRAVGKLYGGHNAAVMALTVNDSAAAANTCVVTGSKDRCLKMFQTSNDLNGLINPRCAVETAHSDGIQSLVLNGSVMFSGARDMGIVKWDVSVDSLQLRQSIPNAHRDWICGLACLPSSGAGASGGPLLLSACRAGVLKVWNSANCALLGELQAHIGSVNDVTSCASTLSAFTASADRTIRIWKVVDGN